MVRPEKTEKTKIITIKEKTRMDEARQDRTLTKHSQNNHRNKERKDSHETTTG